MHILVVACLASIITIEVCSGARMTTITTTTTMPPPSSPTPLTMAYSPELPTVPPQVCTEATSTISPLGRLRSAMRDISYVQKNVLDAFIIFYTDEHLSEEPSADERRLEYFSGWDGPGTAVVLADGEAAVWVPAGDVRRARAVLSCAWNVLDADNPSQTSVAEWIIKYAPRNARIGADSRLTSINQWQMLLGSLQREGMSLLAMSTLLDQLWNEELDPEKRRPEVNRVVAKLHNSSYTGMTWRQKVDLVRNELRLIGVDAMVVTALDEVAWLLNIRGRDLPYAPLLKAFVVVSVRELRVYAPAGKLSMPVREALAVYNCFPNSNNCTRVKDYSDIYADLRKATESKILIPTEGTFQRGASAAIAQIIPLAKRLFQPSPILYFKAQKNQAEVMGMHKAHLRDAVAMCTVLSYLEVVGKSGLNELTVATKVDITRGTQAGYVSQSMQTRVAFGPSGAEPEYKATAATSRRIFPNSTIVIQSGGQYYEGTTAVTRTLHYGSPTREERRAYTTVLRSLCALATLQTPSTLPAAHTDPVARAPLWAARQDYAPPTGYGMGAALNRKEDPVVIDYRQDINLHTFREGYFITSEPAWYEAGKFGAKLGNVLEVLPRAGGYLGFREATLIPYEYKLIDRNLLTEYEIKWLNEYNERIRKTVGPELKDQGLTDVYYWMMNKTVPIESPRAKKNNPNSAPSYTCRLEIIIVLAAFALSYY
ncbi:xaa-Pro aminopeptidase 1-like isoform X2 [Bicyclus anynana]|uniref:Xaa-Pro aminopeptidase 1-like isoform X2 n=1 Tax=Bicyclus anynana TaxID=110368 RepID=A0A6J1NZD1_BICAN|nr:xaa-Pro aminopeptidase 1-like isoform X2 [Bicyclus anynana]